MLLIFFLLALVLGVPVLLVVLLVSVVRLKRRTEQLETALRALSERLEAPRPPASALGGAAAWPVPWAPLPGAPPPAAPETGAEAPEAIAADTAAARSAAPGTATASLDQDRAIVMRQDRLAELANWVRANWVYVVSAMSLAAAGVFFVQYGIERGIMPPPLRVLFAVLFGAALVGLSEWIGRRRRRGGAAASAATYLAEVFAGAGLVSIFAGLVAGRQMYMLFGPEVAFAGLVLTSVLAVILGWRNGPFLAAVGLVGAAATPLLVSADTGAAPWLYGHYLLIGLTALAVDAVRRWAWVSVLGLVMAYGGGFLMHGSGAGAAGWALVLVALALAAVSVPVLRLVPDHAGPSVTEATLLPQTRHWPPFPVRLAAGAALASTLSLIQPLDGGASGALIAFGALALLALAYLLWADPAPGLDDLAAVPTLGFLALIFLQADFGGSLFSTFRAQAIDLRPPESAPPLTVTGLLCLAALISAAAGWRAVIGTRHRLAFGVGAVCVAPLATLLFEVLWQPAPVLGAALWAGHVMAVGALMVLLALRFAKADGADRRRAAYATIAALSMIALSLFLLTAAAPLTLALAALVLVTAALDRRVDLPELGWFLHLGVVVLAWRLTVNPGLDWALAAPLTGVFLVFLGAICATVAARLLLRPLDRTMPKGVLESAAAGFAALLANVLVTRWLGNADLAFWEWSAEDWTLNALPWLIVMIVQLYRPPQGGALGLLRTGNACVAGALALVGLVAALIPANPLFAADPLQPGAILRGPLIFDTLLLAYGVPALLLIGAAWKLPGLGRRIRPAFAVAGAVPLSVYAGLEIRRFWQGDFLGVPGVSQPELYSYTLAMMLTGAGLLYQAIARRSALLRRIAMAVIAVTVAKVFLVDASGLTGLTRVASFLGLGLSLAGLAWLNRWAGTARAGPGESRAKPATGP